MTPTTLGFLLVAITGFCWSGVGILFSNISRKGHDFIGIRVRTSLIAAVVAWILYPDYSALLSDPSHQGFRLAAVLIPASLIGTTGMFMMNLAMSRGHNGASWTFGQSALIIPFLAGIVFWGEEITVQKLIGIFGIISSVFFFGIQKEHKTENEPHQPASPGWFLPACCAFFFLGIQQTFMTLPSHWENWEDTHNLRVPVLLLGMTLSNTLIRLIQGPRQGKRPWHYIATGVFISLTSQWIMFLGIDALKTGGKAGLAFPVAIGVCVLVFSAYSLFWLKEKTSKLHLAGMVCGIAGILTLALR